MRGTVVIDPSYEGSDDVDSSENLDIDTATAPNPSSAQESPQNSAGQSDFPASNPSKISRRQSLDSQNQSNSNRSKKEGGSTRRASVGVLPLQSDVASRNSSLDSESDSAMEGTQHRKRMWKAINQASHELNRESRRMFSFIRRRFRGRGGQKETSVKEIHINPEEDEERWACRSTSVVSNTTSRASSNSDDGPNVNRSLNVVPDMNDEYR